MIEYELAKKLKDADFPYAWCDDEHMESGICDDDCFPTLSELIAACEPRFKLLKVNRSTNIQENQKWCATTDDVEGHNGHGSTPEIAVARLWLALNKK